MGVQYIIMSLIDQKAQQQRKINNRNIERITEPANLVTGTYFYFTDEILSQNFVIVTSYTVFDF